LCGRLRGLGGTNAPSMGQKDGTLGFLARPDVFAENSLSPKVGNWVVDEDNINASETINRDRSTRLILRHIFVFENLRQPAVFSYPPKPHTPQGHVIPPDVGEGAFQPLDAPQELEQLPVRRRRRSPAAGGPQGGGAGGGTQSIGKTWSSYFDCKRKCPVRDRVTRCGE